jgi:pimeloyl-ACP methyl ester carboxylesterase
MRVTFSSGHDGTTDWALARPPAAGDLWWVMVHGHGSSGDQLYTRPDIRAQWLPLADELGLGVLTPHTRGNAWMGPAAAADTHDLLSWAHAQYGARRFVFASGSMGGTSSLIYAVLHPADVAGVIALCPATDLASYYEWCRGTAPAFPGAARNEPIIRQIADAIQAAYGGAPAAQPERYQRHSALAQAARLTMPLYLVHGTADPLIPVSGARRLAGALADHPALVYRELADGGHDAPLPAMPEAWRWIAAKLRAQ